MAVADTSDSVHKDDQQLSFNWVHHDIDGCEAIAGCVCLILTTVCELKHLVMTGWLFVWCLLKPGDCSLMTRHLWGSCMWGGMSVRAKLLV